MRYISAQARELCLYIYVYIHQSLPNLKTLKTVCELDKIFALNILCCSLRTKNFVSFKFGKIW